MTGEEQGTSSWGSGRLTLESPWRDLRLGEVPHSPNFCEKIFSKVTSPRSSRYFCMTLRMLQGKGTVRRASELGLQALPRSLGQGTVCYLLCVRGVHARQPVQVREEGMGVPGLAATP